jgi:hypothetical protein
MHPGRQHEQDSIEDRSQSRLPLRVLRMIGGSRAYVTQPQYRNPFMQGLQSCHVPIDSTCPASRNT